MDSENNKKNVPKASTIILGVCLVCGLGCLLVWGIIKYIDYDKKAGFQFSELRIEFDGYIGSDVLGAVKNVSGKDCKTLQVNIDMVNGSLTEKSYFTLENVKNNRTHKINRPVYLEDDENAEDYKIKVTDVECQND